MKASGFPPPDGPPATVFPLDNGKPFRDQATVGHNRWHPAIPPAATVRPGETFRVDCREWFDGHIRNDESAADVLTAPFHQGHQLSGPFEVAGAKPGDLLVVDIVDIGPISDTETGPLAGQGWGYTGIFPRTNGGSLLIEQFPDAYKAIWDLRDGRATSRHIPGVSFEAKVHPGVMGTAPSEKLLRQWNRREAALAARRPFRVPPLALPPLAEGALLGGVGQDQAAAIAVTAAQTAPPRENGGNMDIKNLTRGARVFYPVYVEGGLLSVGDLHFSQGDGEVTLCGAIEMGGFVDLHVDVIPDGMEKYGIQDSPAFLPGDPEPRYDEWISFPGISVTRKGRQKYLDARLAYQQACLHAIDYLTSFGYTPEQAYLLIGAAPVEGRLSGVVDFPNACATIYLPTAIFDFDVRPSADGPHQVVQGLQPPSARADDLPREKILRAVPVAKRALLPSPTHLRRYAASAAHRLLPGQRSRQK